MRVLIVPNTENPEALAAARELSSWLLGEGHEPAMLPEDAQVAGEPALASTGVPGLVVTLGGDGTILRAVHALDDDVPVLGVNLGRLGFLTGADAGEARDVIRAALAGEVGVERLTMLDVRTVAEDGTTSTDCALNEVFVGRGAGARAVDLSVSVNGGELLRFVCDGVIVATPAGSTAYALSVGGPVVAPSVCGTLLVPVGAHTLQQRPFVLGPDTVVEIRCPNPQRADASVIVDGVSCSCPRFDRVEVRRGGREVRLLRPHGRHFYEVVRRKFLGG